jgi:iron complex transport system substrate-binding protein
MHDTRLWDLDGIGSRSPYAEVERMFALDAGVFFGNTLGPARLLRQVGLPTLFFGNEHGWDEYLRSAARLMTVVSGNPERAEALIAENHQAYANIDADLGVVPRDEQPRVLVMGTKPPYYIKTATNPYQAYLLAAQVKNASVGLAGQRQDAERILAMDPDFIFLMASGKSPQEFMANPLWRGLKAVRDKRVYRTLGMGGGGLMGLTYQPVSVRWMAEIVYPHKLKPQVREQLRELYFPRFGYRMSDAEIDADLHLDVNAGSDGYARFAVPTTSEKTSP